MQSADPETPALKPVARLPLRFSAAGLFPALLLFPLQQVFILAYAFVKQLVFDSWAVHLRDQGTYTH